MATQRKPPRTAATLADVGRAAGVSAMAASAVLNGARTSSRFSAETRQRILDAAAALNYRPNAAARGLADRRMHTLGVATTLAQGGLNQYFLEVFSGFVAAAAEAGQNTTVFALPDWGPAGAARLPALCDGRIDGLLLLAPLLAPGAAVVLPAHTPFVSVHANHPLPGVPDLEPDEEAGAHAMVAHLIALGHRRILHLGGPAGLTGADRRAAGYLRAHAEAGLQPLPGGLLRGGYQQEAGRQALEAWLQQHRGEAAPQAVFAANDAVALGCLEALSARGWRVPEDVSVAGFDDTLVAQAAGLSTVRQPLQQMGREAAALLLAHVEARHGGPAVAAPAQRVFATELVPGRTVAAPRRSTLRID